MKNRIYNDFTEWLQTLSVGLASKPIDRLAFGGSAHNEWAFWRVEPHETVSKVVNDDRYGSIN